MSGILNSIQSEVENLWRNLTNGLDSIFPPDKRNEMLSKLQEFAILNPKLAAFLATHVVLTGIPILFFLTFSVSVFVLSLITALLIGLLAALLFTFFIAGVAFLFLVPTLFVTTFIASFLFLWGCAGYYILNWLSGGSTSASDGETIGDKINNLTERRTDRSNTGAPELYNKTHIDANQAPCKGNDGTIGVTDDNNTERGPQKVTEDLGDSTNPQSRGLLTRTLEVVEGDGNAVNTEKPIATVTKESFDGATEMTL